MAPALAATGGPQARRRGGALSAVVGAATLRTGATPGRGRRRPARPRGVRMAWRRRRRRRAAVAASRAGATEVWWRRRGRVGRAGEGERALRERKRRKEGETRGGDIFTQRTVGAGGAVLGR